MKARSKQVLTNVDQKLMYNCSRWRVRSALYFKVTFVAWIVREHSTHSVALFQYVALNGF